MEPVAGVITGTVFEDVDGDAAGDVPLPSVDIYLDLDHDGVLDADEPTTATSADDPSTTDVDESGRFAFDGLWIGTYTVRVVPPANYRATAAGSFTADIVDADTGVDGEISLEFVGGDIAGVLFDDADRDGVFDAVETPRAGVTVFVDADGDGVLDGDETSATTDADGGYVLPRVPAGRALVTIDVAPPLAVTGDAVGIPRLFAAPFGSTNVFELSPADGSLLNYRLVSGSPTSGSEIRGLAMDDSYLYLADDVTRSILVVSPNSPDNQTLDVVDTISWPGSNVRAFDGLAVLGDTLFALDSEIDVIYVYDLLSDAFVTSFDIVDLNPSTPHHPGYIDLDYGLGESADGESLVVSTIGHYRLIIDPTSGAITGSIAGEHDDDIAGGIGGGFGELYSGRFSVRRIDVYDGTDAAIDVIPALVNVESLAAGPSDSVGTIVVVPGSGGTASDDVTLDLGLAMTTGVINGVQFDDADGDGVRDDGESPLAGVTVFVDLNDNFHPDADEPVAVTTADGSYAIADVPAGTHTVRAVSPTGYRPGPPAVAEERLFAAVLGEYETRPELQYPLYGLSITELDTIDEVPIDTITTDLMVGFDTEIAFYKDRFIVTDNYLKDVHQLAMDGSLIRTVNFTPPDAVGYFADYGATVFGDSLISVAVLEDRWYLSRFDVDTGRFEIETPITIEPLSLPTANIPVPGPDQWSASVGRSADGTAIELHTWDQGILMRIDPATGAAELRLAPESGWDAGDSIGGRRYTADASNTVRVYDSADQQLRNLPWFGSVFGLAAGTSVDSGVSVTIVGGDAATVDHGHLSTLSSVSGTVRDAGIDGGDPTPRGGATVFLDLDGDGVFDADEPSAVTDADGTYRIDDVPEGRSDVRVVEPAGTDVTADADDRVRLFIYQTPTLDQSRITEVDAATGETLRTFDGLAPIGYHTGMAADAGHLYVSQFDGIRVIDLATGTEVRRLPVGQGEPAGLAVIEDTLYYHDVSNNRLFSRNLVNGRHGPVHDLNSFLYVRNDDSSGLSVAPDGRTLLLGTGTDVFQIDPADGSLIETFYGVYPNNSLAGSALPGDANGRWYEPHRYRYDDAVRNFFIESLAVRDAEGRIVREIPLDKVFGSLAMAAACSAATSHRVAVNGSAEYGGNDFTVTPQTGRVTGVRFVDGDADGVRDADEPGLPGAVVFVDSDADGIVDADEPQTVTDADGGYVLDNVPIGDALVRSIAPAGYRPGPTATSHSRVFGIAPLDDLYQIPVQPTELIELDPISGMDFAKVTLNIDPTWTPEIAFDGQHFLMIDNFTKQWYRLDPAGDVFDSGPLDFEGLESNLVHGTAVAGGATYVLISSGADTNGTELTGHWIYRWDGTRRRFVNRKAVRFPDDGIPRYTDFEPTLSASVDGRRLVAFDQEHGVWFIDPTDGAVTRRLQVPQTDLHDYAAAAVEGQYLHVGAGTEGLSRFDADFSWIEATPSRRLYASLTAGVETWNQDVVTVTGGGTATAADMGDLPLPPSLTGVVRDDTDGDGVSGAGDAGVAGLTVFVDADVDGVLDVDEVSTVTDADGRYEFFGLSAGDHTVRVVDDSGTGTFRTATATTRLFASWSNQSAQQMEVVEIDPRGGQILRSFSGPTRSLGSGLALDERGLYAVNDDQLLTIDPNTGDVRATMTLPTDNHRGAAAVGGFVYALDGDAAVISKIDPVRQIVVDTVYNPALFTRSLGETADGTALTIEHNGDIVTFDFDTNTIGDVVVAAEPYGAMTGDGGVTFRQDSGHIIIDGTTGRVGRIPIGDAVNYAIGLAAATLPSDAALVHLAGDRTTADVDFLRTADPTPADDIGLTRTSITENTPTDSHDILFAELFPAGGDRVADYRYDLAVGDGDDDNAAFFVDDNRLMLRRGTVLDHESRPSYSVRLRMTDPGGTTFQRALTLDVDNLIEITRDDVIVNRSSQRSRLQTIDISFDENVILDADAVTLTHRETGDAVPVRIESTPDGSGGMTVTAMIDTSLPVVADGDYELRIDAAKIRTADGLGMDLTGDGTTTTDFAFGDRTTDGLYQLLGDSDGDGLVSLADFFDFSADYNTRNTMPDWDPRFDFDADGQISLADFFRFSGNYNSRRSTGG